MGRQATASHLHANPIRHTVSHTISSTRSATRSATQSATRSATQSATQPVSVPIPSEFPHISNVCKSGANADSLQSICSALLLLRALLQGHNQVSWAIPAAQHSLVELEGLQHWKADPTHHCLYSIIAQIEQVQSVGQQVTPCKRHCTPTVMLPRGGATRRS